MIIANETEPCESQNEFNTAFWMGNHFSTSVTKPSSEFQFANKQVDLTSSVLNLDMTCCGVDDDGAHMLAKAIISSIPHIQSINLFGNSIGPVGVGYLADTLERPDCKLQALSLDSNPVSLEGASALKHALERNRSLTCMQLSETHMGVLGVKLIAEMLKCNDSLTTLILNNNSCNAEGATAVAEQLAQNKTLTSLLLQVSHRQC